MFYYPLLFDLVSLWVITKWTKGWPFSLNRPSLFLNCYFLWVSHVLFILSGTFLVSRFLLAVFVFLYVMGSVVNLFFLPLSILDLRVWFDGSVNYLHSWEWQVASEAYVFTYYYTLWFVLYKLFSMSCCLSMMLFYVLWVIILIFHHSPAIQPLHFVSRLPSLEDTHCQIDKTLQVSFFHFQGMSRLLMHVAL